MAVEPLPIEDLDGLVEQVRALLSNRDLHDLRDLVASLPQATVASVLGEVPVEERIIVFRILPAELATEVFEFLEKDAQVELLNALGSTRIAFFLNEMSADDRTALLEEMPAPLVRRLLSLLSKEERIVALSLLGYPESSVGRLMSPDYISVHSDWKTSEVLAHVRQHGQRSDSLSVFFVLDDVGILQGEIEVGDLLLAPLDAPVSEFLESNLVVLRPNQDQEEAVSLFRTHGRAVLPVVDSAGILIGIVTIDDALDVAQDEATEDIQKLGAVEGLDVPYLKAPLGDLIRSRATWLVLLFLSETLTASAMAFFESEIDKAVVLALFVPLIISSGGNAGSQAATLIIRAMSIGEIRLKDWWRVFQRELASGAVLGILLGVIGFLRIGIWSLFFNTYGPHWLLIGTTILISLLTVVLWGTLVGAMLPFALRRMGADPATSSAPFVATLVDVVGLVLYFSVAALLLRGTLL